MEREMLFYKGRLQRLTESNRIVELRHLYRNCEAWRKLCLATLEAFAQPKLKSEGWKRSGKDDF